MDLRKTQIKLEINHRNIRGKYTIKIRFDSKIENVGATIYNNNVKTNYTISEHT